jgi:hypothetical protein
MIDIGAPGAHTVKTPSWYYARSTPRSLGHACDREAGREQENVHGSIRYRRDYMTPARRQRAPIRMSGAGES